MYNERRPYKKKLRAELEARTRLRVTESAVELHGTLGPANTSISAVARHAGVRRSTVYRHFQDEAALFVACSTHWLSNNPTPDLAGWPSIHDPEERLDVALRELYAYYRRTERMLEKVLRDEEAMPVVKQALIPFREYLEAAGETLMSGRESRGEARRRVAAAIGHALGFYTWRSLAREQGLGDPEAADLMCRLVRSAGGAVNEGRRAGRSTSSAP